MRTAVYSLMSEATEPGLELLERQNRFVSEHLRRIFVQMYRLVENVADAQDLTQEAFIKALQHQDQLKDEQKAAHWLSKIATNTAIDFLRRNSRATFCEIDQAPESHGESPEQILLRAEHREYLEDGLRLLSPRERADSPFGRRGAPRGKWSSGGSGLCARQPSKILISRGLGKFGTRFSPLYPIFFWPNWDFFCDS